MSYSEEYKLSFLNFQEVLCLWGDVLERDNIFIIHIYFSWECEQAPEGVGTRTGDGI